MGVFAVAQEGAVEGGAGGGDVGGGIGADRKDVMGGEGPGGGVGAVGVFGEEPEIVGGLGGEGGEFGANFCRGGVGKGRSRFTRLGAEVVFAFVFAVFEPAAGHRPGFGGIDASVEGGTGGGRFGGGGDGDVGQERTEREAGDTMVGRIGSVNGVGGSVDGEAAGAGEVASAEGFGGCAFFVASRRETEDRFTGVGGVEDVGGRVDGKPGWGFLIWITKSGLRRLMFFNCSLNDPGVVDLSYSVERNGRK